MEELKLLSSLLSTRRGLMFSAFLLSRTLIRSRSQSERLKQILRYKTTFMAELGGTLQEEFTPVSIPVSSGGTIAGKAWGNPKGQPVLGLHGWLNNAATFDNIAPLLDKDIYFVSIDLPGHGHSYHRSQSCRLHFIDYLVDVRDVIKGLGWDKFSFFCHSMGAGVASIFAAAQPDFVEKMVLIENIGVMTRPKEDLPRLLGRALNSPPVPTENKVYKTWDEIVNRMWDANKKLDSLLGKDDVAVIARRGTLCLDEGYKFSHDNRLKEPSLLYLPHETDAEFIKAIQCPTLLIIAEESVFKEGLHKKVENAGNDKIKVVTAPGGHHLQLYSHKNIAPLANQFLLSSSIS